MAKSHKEWLADCIESCRCNGEIITSGAAEMLLGKFTEHMDQVSPVPAAPHQQYVTDANGVAKWEDKLCYEAVNKTIMYDGKPVVVEDGYSTYWGVHSTILTTNGNILTEMAESDVLTVVFDGAEYDCAVIKPSYYEEYYVGNGKLWREEYAEADYPFCVSIRPNASESCLYVLSVGTYPLVILKRETELKTISEKFLPTPVFYMGVRRVYDVLPGGLNGTQEQFEHGSYVAFNDMRFFAGDISNGTSFTCVYDGVTYTSNFVATDSLTFTHGGEESTSVGYIGNVHLADKTRADTGEPFCVCFDGGARGFLFFADGGTHELEVYSDAPAIFLSGADGKTYYLQIMSDGTVKAFRHYE